MSASADERARADVLVVDDEPTIGEVVARYLERAGYRTRVAGDGAQALAMSAQSAPDLVVLDVMLPSIDGLEVMRRLHEPESAPLARPAAAREDRAQPGASALYPDGLGGRLPLPAAGASVMRAAEAGMTAGAAEAEIGARRQSDEACTVSVARRAGGSAIRYLVLVLCAALAPACTIMAVLGGAHAVLVTAEILVPVGLVALGLTDLARRGWIPLDTLRRRFELGVALALGQLLAAVAIGAAVMFVSGHDAWMTIAIVLFAAVVVARAAQLLLDGVITDIRAIGDGLHALERGERDLLVDACSSRELEEVAHSVNRLIAALTQEERARDSADAARRHVIAAVSHDLRTPLSTLGLLAQALEDDLVDQETARRYVGTIGVNVRMLGALIDDLFELSCLDAGEISWRMEAIDLRGLIGEATELARPAAEAGDISLTLRLPDDLAPAHANADQLRRVLLNLLHNAVSHTPAGGGIEIRVAPTDGAMIEVEVSDTGEGISPGDRGQVFEPFYRGGEATAAQHPGSGLGLAIARAIIQAHGGRIWLGDSAKGARLHFTLPASGESPR